MSVIYYTLYFDAEVFKLCEIVKYLVYDKVCLQVFTTQNSWQLSINDISH